MEEKIKSCIEEAIPGAVIQAQDLTGSQDHFELIVTSEKFSGMSRIARHQLVMNALQELLKGPLHAVTVKTKTKD